MSTDVQDTSSVAEADQVEVTKVDLATEMRMKLQADISGLYMEELRLKARIKSIHDAMKSKSEELASIEAGQQFLPLDAEECAAAPHAEFALSDDWQKVDLAGLGLTLRTLDKLNEAGMKTLGDFTNFQAIHGERWADEIKGIGPKAAEEIQDACQKFWADNPQYTQEKGEIEAEGVKSTTLVVGTAEVDGNPAGTIFTIDLEELAGRAPGDLSPEIDMMPVFVSKTPDESTSIFLEPGEWTFCMELPASRELEGDGAQVVEDAVPTAE